MSDFKELYKPSFLQLKEQQAQRREKLLEEQRRKREDKFSGQRDIKSPSKWIRQHRESDYKYNLMMSEWMMQCPEDLNDFILRPCPKGTRCTMSNEKSKNNMTKLYYKNGTEFKSIKTNLPRFTVLDCVYTKSAIFILDVMKYDGRDFMDCDTAFRNYWIKNKFMEDDLKIFNKDDETSCNLQLIEAYDFEDNHTIQSCFQTFPLFDEGAELDGFLFYHKEAAYTVGESPLVLWLFGFMIEEVLGRYKVHPQFDVKPENYTTYLDYIYEFNLKLKNKKRRSKNNHSEREVNMDVQDIDEENNEMQKIIDLERFGDFE